MKRLSNLTLFIIGILLVLPIFASENAEKSIEKEQVKKYETLDDALNSGNPVMCLFITSKGCHCTMGKVKAAVALFDTMTVPDDVIYIEVNIDKYRNISRKYKIIALPTVFLFDKNGNELSRLQSWEINKQGIDAKLTKLSEPVKEKK